MLKWTRMELAVMVAALHENQWRGIRASSQRAAEISVLLRSSGIHPTGPRDPKFRSVNSIQRKAENLRTIRESYVLSPTRGGNLDRDIVLDYEARPAAVLAEAADAIRVLELGNDYIPPSEDDGEAILEGKVLMRLHLTRERNPGIRARKIEAVASRGLALACEVCAFDFERTYGTRGRGYIEVHHVRPLHDSGPVETRLSDLAVLCANCHRMIHRTPWLTPAALSALLHERARITESVTPVH